MMTGNATNDELYTELMMTEPDSPDRNVIRQKMKQCFEGVTVLGLPETIPLDYYMLNERFKFGLALMANTILEKSLTPWNVSIGGVERELNSTSAEPIISALIGQANGGRD